MNEIDLTLFGERMKQVLADTRAIKYDMSGLTAQFSALEARFGGLEARLNAVEVRLEHLDTLVDRMTDRMEAVQRGQAALEGRFDAMEGRFDALEGRFERWKRCSGGPGSVTIGNRQAARDAIDGRLDPPSVAPQRPSRISLRSIQATALSHRACRSWRA